MAAPLPQRPRVSCNSRGGFAVPMMTDAAVRSRLFDPLDRCPKTATALASEAGISESGAHAQLHPPACVEHLSKDAAGRYALTPKAARFLVSASPSFLGGIFRHASAQLMPRWAALNDAVRAGRPAPCADGDAGRAAHFQEYVEAIMRSSFPAARASRAPRSRSVRRARGSRRWSGVRCST